MLGIRSNWQLRWVIFTVVFFTAYGAGDQLYVWQFLELGGWMQALSWGVSILLAVWVLYYDPWTSPMFKNQWHLRQSWRRGVLAYHRWKTSRDTTGDTGAECNALCPPKSIRIPATTSGWDWWPP